MGKSSHLTQNSPFKKMRKITSIYVIKRNYSLLEIRGNENLGLEWQELTLRY